MLMSIAVTQKRLRRKFEKNNLPTKGLRTTCESQVIIKGFSCLIKLFFAQNKNSSPFREIYFVLFFRTHRDSHLVDDD